MNEFLGGEKFAARPLAVVSPCKALTMLGKREEWGYSRRGRPGPERGYLVRRRAGFPKVAFATALLICGLAGTAGRAAAQGIAFQAPTIVDPIHTFGEPTIGIDPQGRFFA